MVVGSKRNNTQISCVFHYLSKNAVGYWFEIVILSIVNPAVCAIPEWTSWRPP